MAGTYIKNMRRTKTTARHRKRIGAAISTVIMAIATVISATASPITAFAQQEVDPFDDVNLSIYAGRNVYLDLYESEGSIIANGDIVAGVVAGLAGKVEWGMGYIPVAGADFVAAGGSMNLWRSTTLIGGNIRLGKTLTGSKPTFVTKGDKTGMGISDTPGTLSENLGNDALKVNLDGSNERTDFNGFTENSVIPLADSLRGYATTGTISYSKIDDVNGYQPFKTGEQSKRRVNIKNEGLLIFNGDGHSERQVFDLDLDEINSVYDKNGYTGWSLDFENIPEDAYIVINTHVTPKETKNGSEEEFAFHAGWRTILNGNDVTTKMNSYGDDMIPFRNLASHIIWNFDNPANTKMNFPGNTTQYGNNTMYMLFPGSLVSGAGSIYSFIDTNGRVIAAQDVKLTGSEHHNLPWKASRITNEQTTPEDAEIKLTASKTCDSNEIDLSEFEFQLHEGNDGTGKVLQTKHSDSNGNITFDTIRVSSSDLNGESEKSYSFSVTEVNTGIPYIDYDTHVGTYNVTVSDDGATGWLISSVNQENTTFKNYYNVPTPLPAPENPLFPPVVIGGDVDDNTSNSNSSDDSEDNDNRDNTSGKENGESTVPVDDKESTSDTGETSIENPTMPIEQQDKTEKDYTSDTIKSNVRNTISELVQTGIEIPLIVIAVGIAAFGVFVITKTYRK